MTYNIIFYDFPLLRRCDRRTDSGNVLRLDFYGRYTLSDVSKDEMLIVIGIMRQNGTTIRPLRWTILLLYLASSFCYSQPTSFFVSSSSFFFSFVFFRLTKEWNCYCDASGDLQYLWQNSSKVMARDGVWSLKIVHIIAVCDLSRMGHTKKWTFERLLGKIRPVRTKKSLSSLCKRKNHSK
jgi:hypothetical protein